ncbi:MAG: pyridoxal phosphate-dependent aminotransferase [Candidatus Dadabacteria bacterium]|nr:pyridoxal phosphate-dependent aminotransferase [Candidatus Dadabacteria bacterium]MYC40036.1 pyridoxal phosphate-dependent aminotransferase [Candidatus Dadabacteria bacterium]
MISDLVKNIEPFYVMDILERAKQLESEGRDIVHFEVGEPDLNTPQEICSAAVQWIQEGYTKYTSSLGIDELRQSVAEDYSHTYGVEVGYERVIITIGSSPALLLAMLTVLNPGDEILITDPHYACYPQIINVARGVARKIPVYESDGYQIDPSEVRKNIGKKTKAILVNSPANPTGAVMDADVFRELCEMGLFVISDEIYHGLVYGERVNSVLEFTDDSIAINGFAKLYSMTGWRLGYMIVPEDLVRYVQKLQQNLFISAGSFVQKAGVEAIEKVKKSGKSEAMVAEFDKRRKEMIKGLSSIGFDIAVEPKGAFYVFVNSSRWSRDSWRLAFDILENCHVGVTPGIDFSDRGKDYLRFSYTTSVDSIREGIRRLGEFLG